MKRLIKKLHSKSGESMIEVLVALIIVTLITTSLVQAIVVSSRINRNIKDSGADRSMDYTDVAYVNSAGGAVVVGSPSITAVTADKSGIISNGGVYVQSVMDGTYYSFEGPRAYAESIGE